MPEIRWDFYPHVACTPTARRWLELLAKLQKAPKTLDAYARGLDDFIEACDRGAVSPIEATRSDIAFYVEALTHRPNRKASAEGSATSLSNATLQQRLTAVRVWYDYLIETSIRADQMNPVGRGTYTRRSSFNGARAHGLLPRYERQPWIPGDDQWDAILTVVAREESLRNQAMVFLAYDGALRRSELLAVRVADFDWPHDMLTIRAEIAKNRRGRVIFYSEVTRDLLVSYVRQRGQLLAVHGGAAAGPLFLSESNRNAGQPLSPTMWNKIVQRIVQRAGVPQFTPHTLRHLRLTDLARCHLELYEIALFAGHMNVQTTELYINLSGRELGERVRVATAAIAERMRHKLAEVNDGGRYQTC